MLESRLWIIFLFFTLFFSNTVVLSVNSLMFKEKDAEHKRLVKLYKNNLFVDGICFVDKNNWEVWINGISYTPNAPKVKSTFLITEVTSKYIRLKNIKGGGELLLQPGSVYKLKQKGML